MNTALVIGWIGALLGGALVGVGVIMPMMHDVDVGALIEAIKGSLASGNVERVRLLCRAAPQSLLAAMHAALEAVPGGAAAAFEHEATRLVRARRIRVELTIVGVVLSLGALVQAAPQLDSRPTLVGVHILIWFAGGWVWFKRDRVANDLARIRTELLPLLERQLAPTGTETSNAST